MVIIIKILWVLLFIFALVSPPLALMIYGLIGSDSDAFAVTKLLGILVTNHKFVTRGIFLLAFIISLFCLRKVLKRTSSRVIKGSLIIALALSVLIVSNSIIKGMGLTKSLSVLVYSGLPVFIIWLSTIGSKNYRKMFYVFITINIIFASSVLWIPFLEPLNGRIYQSLSYIANSADGDINYSLPSSETKKEGAISHYAQYHNPNALGFYACVAIIGGLALVLKGEKSNISKLFGIVLCILGIFSWLNSLTRGPALAVFISYLLWSFVPAQNESLKSKRFIRRIVITILITLPIMVTISGMFKYLFVSSDNISVISRLEGYRNGYEAMMSYPLFGVGADWEWPPNGSNPHFLPLSFAAQNGILSGILILILVFVFGFYSIAHAFSSWQRSIISPFNGALGIGLILVVLSIAFTNNITVIVLFGMCLAEAYIRIFNHATNRNKVTNKRLQDISK